MGKTTHPCAGCGAEIAGRIDKLYCSPDCRPRCRIDGCEKPEHSKAMCSAHATRAIRYGDPLAPKLRNQNIGTCSVEGCEKPMRKRGWCVGHWERWRKYGDVGSAQIKERMPAGTGRGEPKNPRGPLIVVDDCMICGSPNRVGEYRSGRFCSVGCQQAWVRTNGSRPTEATCDFCGEIFSLGRGRTGRLQRTDTRWCPDCGRDSPDVSRFRRYGITRKQYEEAQVKGCSICGRKDRKLHVDHDHSCCPARGGSARTCGKCVRGLICGPCNRGLGLFFDDPRALERAAKYLRRQLE